MDALEIQVTDPVHVLALKLPCEACSAMPGQQCRRTWAASVHLERHTAAEKALGLPHRRPGHTRRVA